MADSILEEFFIQIGVDADDLTSFQKAVLPMVHGIQKSLEQMTSSFDVAGKKIDGTQKKVSKSSSALHRHLQGSAKETKAVFGSLKTELLAFAGISLSVGGAVKFISDMTTSVTQLGVQSQALNMSAKALDGWQRSAVAAGSSAQSITSALSSAQNDINTAHTTGNYGGAIYQAANLLGVSQSINGDTTAGQAMQILMQGMRGKSSSVQYTVGHMLGLDNAEIQSNMRGQFLPNVSRYASQSNQSDDEVRRARDMTVALADLGQQMTNLKNNLYEYLIPYAQKMVQEMVQAEPALLRLGNTIANIGTGLAKVWQEMSGMDPKNWTISGDIQNFNDNLKELKQTFIDLGDVISHIKNGEFGAAWDSLKKAWKGNGSGTDALPGVTRHALSAREKINQWADAADDKVRSFFGLPRGLRNNNPGNIDFHGQSGATLERQGGRFAAFNTPFDGLRAMASQLYRYYDGKTTGTHLDTIRKIISTWAPGNENNTAAYISAISKSMGVSANAKLNLYVPAVMASLMKAMTVHENGYSPYSMNLTTGAALAAQRNNVTNNHTGGSVTTNNVSIGTVTTNATDARQFHQELSKHYTLTVSAMGH